MALQARVYSEEKGRQDAFIAWHQRWFGTVRLIEKPSSSAPLGANDGQILVNVAGQDYLVTEIGVMRSDYGSEVMKAG